MSPPRGDWDAAGFQRLPCKMPSNVDLLFLIIVLRTQQTVKKGVLGLDSQLCIGMIWTVLGYCRSTAALQPLVMLALYVLCLSQQCLEVQCTAHIHAVLDVVFHLEVAHCFWGLTASKLRAGFQTIMFQNAHCYRLCLYECRAAILSSTK